MAAKPRILLVDDDPKVLRLLEATLKLKDFAVDKAVSGPDALRWLKGGSRSPDLVISDVQLPGMSGYELFQRLREQRGFAAVPFVFLSTSEPDEIARSLDIGADEFLRKPFSIEELLLRVQRVLDKQQRGSAFCPAVEQGTFDGELRELRFPDLLNLLAGERRSGILRVFPEGVPAMAKLHIEDGQVIHATYGRMVGEPVLLQLLAHEAGRFAFQADEIEHIEPSLAGPTQPILMRGFELIDQGIVWKIDPNNREAVLAQRKIMERVASVHGGPGRETAEASLLGLLSGDFDQRADVADFSETVQAQSQLVELPSQEEIIAQREEQGEDFDPAGSSGEMTFVDDDEDELLLSLGSLTDDVEPIDIQGELPSLAAQASVDLMPQDDPPFAPSLQSIGKMVITDAAPEVHPTSRFGPIDSELLGPDEVAALVGVTSERAGAAAAPEESLAAVSGILVIGEDAPESGASRDSDEVATVRGPGAAPNTGIALVIDDAGTAGVDLSGGGGIDLMALYERLRRLAIEEANADAAQLGTRSGRVIASAIREAERRETVAAFSGQALAFASEDVSGIQFAVLNAVDLHVVVVEVDHLRVFTSLFDRKPDSRALLDLFRPVLLEHKRALEAL